MGIINSMRRNGDKFDVELSLGASEIKHLAGKMDAIHLFCEHAAECRTTISQRGRNEATKYFLIPRELRKNLKFNWNVSCQRINTPEKVIFVYVVDKIS